MIDYGLLFVFTESLRLHYLLSSMLSFSAATVFNYVYSTKYVFQCKKEQNKAGEFTVFLLLSLCGLLLNAVLMKNLVENMAMHYMFAKLFSAMVVSVWNFVSRKIFLEDGFWEKLISRRLLQNR